MSELFIGPGRALRELIARDKVKQCYMIKVQYLEVSEVLGHEDSEPVSVLEDDPHLLTNSDRRCGQRSPRRIQYP